jgi:two-component sensor histidine kinase
MTVEAELRHALEAEREARLEAERLLREKEELLTRNDILLREIDHRIRNSLQLVASMLSLQARQTPDRAASKAIEEARQRIGSIAAVHEQLYRASDTDVVDMSVFLKGLCGSLARNKPGNIRAIHVTAEPIMLVSQRAMKIGILVGELVTNSFKHAFPEARAGEIEVVLTAAGEKARLIVADDGIGLPAGFSTDDSHGLGMRLIHSILGQFGGTLRANSGPGARFMIECSVSDSGPSRSPPV